MSTITGRPSVTSIDLLESWMDYCLKQHELHTKARAHYKFLSRLLFIPACILGSGSGASSIATTSTNITSIIFGTISVLSVGLFTLHNKLNLDEKVYIHDLYSDSFFLLANDIKTQLALHETGEFAYKSIADFTRECKARYDTLVDKAPAIPGRIASNGPCGADMC